MGSAMVLARYTRWYSQWGLSWCQQGILDGIVNGVCHGVSKVEVATVLRLRLHAEQLEEFSMVVVHVKCLSLVENME